MQRLQANEKAAVRWWANVLSGSDANRRELDRHEFEREARFGKAIGKEITVAVAIARALQPPKTEQPSQIIGPPERGLTIKVLRVALLRNYPDFRNGVPPPSKATTRKSCAELSPRGREYAKRWALIPIRSGLPRRPRCITN